MVDRKRRGVVAGITAFASLAAVKGYSVLEALLVDMAKEGAEEGWELIVRNDWNAQVLDRKDPIDAENTRLLGKLIGYQADRTIMLAGGREHFRHPGVMHHDNEWAANTVLDVFRGFKPAVERTEKMEELDPQGSYVLCGSPTSNGRAAEIMQYELIAPDKPEYGFRRVETPVLNLPISFELDSEWLLRNGHVAPESVDNERTPQWGIRIKGEFFETRQGEKDFLLISRLPNWRGARPYQDLDELDVVVNLGGCTGAGTSSIVKLPDSGDLLRRLDNLTEKHRFWQAVIRIDNIKSGFHPIKKEDRFQATSLSSEIFAAEPVNWN